MTADYTIVFEIVKEEAASVVGGVELSEVAECNEIGELVRLSEALKEPEPLSFLMG